MIRREVRTETREVEVITKICDGCGNVIGDMLEEGMDFQFKLTRGYGSPQDGTVTTLDLCKICAENLVITLEEDGYKIRTEDWNW